MPQAFKRLINFCLGVDFIIPAPASLCKPDGFDLLVMDYHFSKNRWEVRLGLNPVAHAFESAQGGVAITKPICYDAPFTSPSGNPVFTHEEAVDFVRKTVPRIENVSKEAQDSLIACFERKAYDCGWRGEPTFPARITAVAAHKIRKSLES